jgi:hypothetical protein
MPGGWGMLLLGIPVNVNSQGGFLAKRQNVPSAKRGVAKRYAPESFAQ